MGPVRRARERASSGSGEACSNYRRRGCAICFSVAHPLRPGRDLSWLHGRKLEGGAGVVLRGRRAHGRARSLGDRCERARASWARRSRGGAGVPRARGHLVRSTAPRRYGRGRGTAACSGRSRRADLRPRRLRRRRNLRHRARDPGVERAQRRCRLASPEQVRGGLRRLGRDDRTSCRGGREAHPHRRLRHHGGGGGRGGPPARRRHDRHRPPSSRRGVAALSDRRHPALLLPVSRPLRHRRRRQARAGAPWRRPPGRRSARRPRRACHDRRCRPTRRREPGTHDHRPPRPLPHSEARPPSADAGRRRRPGDRRRDGGRIPACAAHQCSGTTRPARCGPAPCAYRRRAGSRSARE